LNSNKTGRLKHIFDLYTSDLSYEEIERLLKQDAADVYEFFKRDLPKPDRSLNRVARTFIFLRSIFSAFLLKLNPARRFFYFVSVLFLIVGLNPNMEWYLVFSFIIINLLLAFELADKLLVKDELEVAQKIQAQLVPKVPPVIEGYEIAFHYESAKEVGGDYLDFISPLGSGKNFIVIGDVSGKGIAAALYVVRVQAIIHQLAENFTSLKNLVSDLKKYFSHNLRREFFLTMAAIQLNEDKSASLCRAGHNPVVYFSRSTNEITDLKPSGMAIGFNDTSMFDKVLQETSFIPGIGDIIFMYTDGVSETMNESKILFGEEKVKKIISNSSSMSCEEIKNTLLNSIYSFKGRAQISDDLAFIIIKRIS